VDAGNDQTLTCSQPCTDLTASYLDLRQTDSYLVESIAYAPPIAYNQSGGTAVSVNIDDVYSTAITLPFPFCFYGITYNSLLIGSNGNLNFNVGNAGGYCPWPFTANCPSPNLVAAGNIFGIYHDIDPSVCGNIKWHLIGNAPCRQFVVSFDEICQYSCTSIKSRHMMVLYETSNFIDVYVEAKPLCSGWNSGNAIIGIQDPTGNTGITAPNRNTTPTWTVTTPEGWRFKPDGVPMYTFEWMEGANVIGTSSTINVCPSTTTTYTANITYTRCDALVITHTDDVTIIPSASNINVSQLSNTNSTCGQANGSVEITGSGGTGPYTYSIDSVNYSSSGLFTNLTAGNYTLFVQDTLGCIQPFTATIIDSSSLNATFTNISNISCYGFANGVIDVSASGGTPSYAYSLNQGSPQNGGQFNLLGPGSYQIIISDSTGCTFQLDTNITEPQAITITELSNTSSLCGQSNGGVEIGASGGTPSYTYSIDSVNFSNSGLFTNLNAGTYTLYAMDSLGCIESHTSIILDQSTLTGNFVSVTNVSCFGGNNGVIEVQAIAGTPSYSYSIGTLASQNTGMFNGLIAGTYSINITDSLGCVFQLDTSITQPSQINISEISNVNSLCGQANGEVEIIGSGGTPSYTYSIDSINFSNSGLFTNLNAGTYLLYVQDSLGCIQNHTTIISDSNSLSGSFISITNILCFGQNNGTIDLVGINGNAPYSYTINNSSTQNNGQFNSLAAGTYQIIVSDSLGCTYPLDTTLSEPPLLIATITSDQNICEGESVNLNVMGSGGTPNYTYLWSNNSTSNNITVSPITSLSYSVIITDSNGCTISDSSSITVTPFPIINVIANPTTGYSPLTVVFNNNSINTTSYYWVFDNGETLNTNNNGQETTTYYNVGLYQVELTASNGPCELKWYEDIEVLPYDELEIEVPNVFTPNNDGSNEGFHLNLTNALSINAVIVNRWGDKMIELNDLSAFWDGKINGNPAKEGVYYIKYTVVGLNGEEKTGHGFFHLTR